MENDWKNSLTRSIELEIVRIEQCQCFDAQLNHLFIESTMTLTDGTAKLISPNIRPNLCKWIQLNIFSTMISPQRTINYSADIPSKSYPGLNHELRWSYSMILDIEWISNCVNNEYIVGIIGLWHWMLRVTGKVWTQRAGLITVVNLQIACYECLSDRPQSLHS